MHTFQRSSSIALALSLYLIQPLLAQSIDLGAFTETNINGNRISSGAPPEEAFNGITSTNGDGWLGRLPVNQGLTFDFNLKENTDFDSDRYDTVQLTLNIWSGGVNNIQGLEQFEIRITDPGGSLNQATPLTDFTSFSGVKIAVGNSPIDNTPIAMSLDADGLFNVESLGTDYQAHYTIVFNVPSTFTSLRVRMPSSAGNPGQYTIEDIQLSAVVPEPSSYALLLASGMAVFIGLRRRSAKK